MHLPVIFQFLSLTLLFIFCAPTCGSWHAYRSNTKEQKLTILFNELISFHLSLKQLLAYSISETSHLSWKTVNNWDSTEVLVMIPHYYSAPLVSIPLLLEILFPYRNIEYLRALSIKIYLIYIQFFKVKIPFQPLRIISIRNQYRHLCEAKPLHHPYKSQHKTNPLIYLPKKKHNEHTVRVLGSVLRHKNARRQR